MCVCVCVCACAVAVGFYPIFARFFLWPAVLDQVAPYPESTTVPVFVVVVVVVVDFSLLSLYFFGEFLSVFFYYPFSPLHSLYLFIWPEGGWVLPGIAMTNDDKYVRCVACVDRQQPFSPACLWTKMD